MKLVLVAATPFEVHPLHQHLEQEFKRVSPIVYTKGETEIHLLITGIGIMATAYTLGRYMAYIQADLVINLGIAGAFHQKLSIGDVVHIVSDELGDLGIEEADGSFSTLFDAELMDKNQFPFQEGILIDKHASAYNFLPKVSGLTINKVHGETSSIEKCQAQFKADIESMEGAAFMFVCLQEEVPFLQIRAISNYVESRNKENWNIPLAINNLNKVALEIIRDVTNIPESKEK